MATKKNTPKKRTSKKDISKIANDSSNLFAENNIAEEPKQKYKEQCYFIQFNISNLYDCFSSGLIAPAIYIDERTCDDIQSKFPNSLLISKGFMDLVDITQCLIDISLKPSELKSNSTAVLINKPLPITRIKRIIINDEIVREKIIKTALSQDVGFIPENIFSLFDNKIKKVKLPELYFDETLNLKKEINVFDRLLGLFAFIKNQQLYYALSTNVYSNYSEHFFEAFSIVNSEIEIQCGQYLKNEFIKAFSKLFDYNNSEVSQPNSYIIKHIYDNGLFDAEFIDKYFDIFADTSLDKKTKLNNLKINLLNQIGKKITLQPLLEINDKFFKVAYLYIYGKKGSNDKEILKNLILKELPYSQSEITLALLGMYYGYKQLRTYETIEFNDTKIDKLLGTQFNLKFKLDNKLDYVLIESIYEFIFNKIKADKNILSFQPKIKEDLSKIKQFKAFSDYEIEFERELFESCFYKVRKSSDFTKISQLLSSFPEILQSHLHIVSFIKKHYDNDYYLLRGSKNIVFKNDFLKLFEEGKLKLISFDHLVACVELDKKYNLK